VAVLAVLGAGAWGTALGVVLAARHRVTLWARDPGQAAAMRAARCNARYLPGVALPQALELTAELPRSVADAELLIAAVPVAALRELCARLSSSRAPLVWACKGFEQGSGLLPHQIVEESLPALAATGVLSGPSFALEVARGLPCALTLAARDAGFARRAAALLHGGRMRVYFSTDLLGVELGGAAKNVIAIAAGISDGLDLGQNARAALITRGLAEITRLGAALGGTAETLMGLAGAGDLILTATGDLSRNRAVGLDLGRSAREVARLAAHHGVEMPVCAAVNAVLDGVLTPREAVARLLARDPKEES
jgi:glycerol-3-phosphate dehydrogenase (NAD(P)+)